MNLGRWLVLPLMVFVIGFFTFLRTPGADHVRTVQILSLIAAGMGLGVAVARLKEALSSRERK